MPGDAPSAAAKFGRLIRAGRSDAGLTQDELAARTGLGQSTLSSYESGNAEPSFSNVVVLASVLGLSLDDLATAFPRPTRRRRPELAAAS